MTQTLAMPQNINHTNLDSKPVLLFDWDGTIVDSNNYKINVVWQETFSGEPERQSKIAEIFTRPIGKKLFRYALIALVIFETDPEQKDLEGVGNDDEWIQTDPRITKYSDRFGELLEDHTKMPVFDGVKDALTYLSSNGYKMYVVSGGGKEDILKQADSADITKYFSGIYANTASKPEHFKTICKIEGNDDPQNYLIIGDGPNDLKFSQDIGIPFIGIDNDFNDWESGKVDFRLIKNVRELVFIL